MCTERQISSKMENIDSCEDDILVNELRSALSDLADESPLFSEYFYLHLWLKSISARKMKVKDAEKAIRNSWKWRKGNNLTDVEIIQTAEEVEFFDFLPADITGRDKDGAPVFQMSVGVYRTNACLDRFGRESFVRIMSGGIARAEKILLEYHRNLRETKNSDEHRALRSKGITSIMNFAHFSFRNVASLAAIKAGLEATKIFGAYFSGHIEKIILINVNSIVSTVLKPFLPLLSGAPVEIYGTDSNEWKPKLYSLIDPSQLLPSYGGTKRAGKVEDVLSFYANSKMCHSGLIIDHKKC